MKHTTPATRWYDWILRLFDKVASCRAPSLENEQLSEKPASPHHYVKRQLRPIQPPLHRCGLASAPAAQLPLETSVQSDLAALCIWDVILNGEQVHSPHFSPLLHKFKGNIRTVADLERIACRYPDSEWLLRFVEPLQSSVYQRHAGGQWNLVKVGSGMF